MFFKVAIQDLGELNARPFNPRPTQASARLDEGHQGVDYSIVTNDYPAVDDDVCFSCVGVDSSRAEFSILDLY